MFGKIVKWTGIVLGGLVALVVVLGGALYAVGNGRLTKKYDVQPAALTIPTDQASIDQGKKWAQALCTECHAEDFSGKPLVDDTTIGFVPAPNLTPGQGGAGGEFADADWVRAIRYGVDPEGRALIGMPSMNYYYLSDQDAGDIIAYLKTLPAVDHDMGEPAMSAPGKLLLGAGAFGPNILPAEVVQRAGPPAAAVQPGANAQYGAYLVRLGGCRDCHGENLTGGHSPAPGSPYAPDLSQGGAVGQWSQETFITAVRTNKGKGMPWGSLRPFSDEELQAIYLYLQSLPPR